MIKKTILRLSNTNIFGFVLINIKYFLFYQKKNPTSSEIVQRGLWNTVRAWLTMLSIPGLGF